MCNYKDNENCLALWCYSFSNFFFYFAIFLSLFSFKCSNIHQFNDFITSVKASLHFYVVEYRTKKLFNYYSDKNMLCWNVLSHIGLYLWVCVCTKWRQKMSKVMYRTYKLMLCFTYHVSEAVIQTDYTVINLF